MLLGHQSRCHGIQTVEGFRVLMITSAIVIAGILSPTAGDVT